MTDAIALLWPPFLVALCLIGIHTYFGIQVLAPSLGEATMFRAAAVLEGAAP